MSGTYAGVDVLLGAVGVLSNERLVLGSPVEMPDPGQRLTFIETDLTQPTDS